MKKNIAKKMIVMVMVLTMLFNSTIASAEEHNHAYSYVGNTYIKTQQVSEHQVLIYNSAMGKMERVTCYIYVDIYAKVFKCGCGDTQYEYFSRTWHSKCGQ